MPKQKKFPSELRFDPVSKDWVVIATGRAKRPETFRRDSKQPDRLQTSQFNPFENLADQEKPVEAFYKGKKVQFEAGTIPEKWTTISIPNKFPAFSTGRAAKERIVGPYQVLDGIGYHEVIITKDTKKDIPEFSIEQTQELIDMYHARYLDLQEKDLVNYIAIFKNKGRGAGATVAHPHSQIIAIPVVDPDLHRSLEGSQEYFKKHGKGVHSVMLEWDLKDKSRIVFENKEFVAVCPFASRVAFELRIYPKKQSAYFETITEKEKTLLAEVFQHTMKKLSKALRDPDYNYFLHTAPVEKGAYDHYHWHWEILPKTSTWAGFELGAGIEISTIEPEQAAAFLRKQ